jgi:glycosyltransferase involved in cell wall biosynthesis
LDDVERVAFQQRTGIGFEYLLFVGTLQPRKNLVALVEAYGQLRARNRREHHLVLVGRRGWAFTDVFRRVHELGLERVVHHFDAADSATLVGFYNAATALVLPSRYEGFGLPVLEAMSCGCPVISSNAAALPEVCGDAALLFDPGDVDALAALLERLVDDAAVRGELIRRGFANCSRFSWERTARQAAAVYHAA